MRALFARRGTIRKDGAIGTHRRGDAEVFPFSPMGMPGVSHSGKAGLATTSRAHLMSPSHCSCRVKNYVRAEFYFRTNGISFPQGRNFISVPMKIKPRHKASGGGMRAFISCLPMGERSCAPRAPRPAHSIPASTSVMMRSMTRVS